VASAVEKIASPPTSSQTHAPESGSKWAGVPCHQSRGYWQSRRIHLKNTKVEESYV